MKKLSGLSICDAAYLIFCTVYKQLIPPHTKPDSCFRVRTDLPRTSIALYSLRREQGASEVGLKCG